MKTMKPGLEVMEINTLKIEERVSEKHVATRQKEINKNLDDFKKEIALPTKTNQRYYETFGKNDEKIALKATIAAFIAAFLFLLFIQPSILFVNTDDQLKVVNYSERELKNLKVYEISDLLEIFSKNKEIVVLQDKVAPNEEIIIPIKETSLFIAFADRQIPAIGSVILPETYQTNNINKQEADNNTGIYKGIKGQMAE